RALLADGVFKLRLRCTRFQPQGDLRPRFSVQDVPAFGFAARLTGGARRVIIGMHLHRQFVAWKKELDQQRKAVGLRRGFANQFAAKALTQLAESRSCKRAVRHFAVVARQPSFANGLRARSIAVNGAQVARSPGPWAKLRHEAQWIEVGHDPTATITEL